MLKWLRSIDWAAISVSALVLVAVLLIISEPAERYQSIGRADTQTSEIASPSPADERLADYTHGLEIFTGFLVAIACIQAALFVWQLRYMRAGVKDAEDAANAAKSTAEAAKSQVDLARDDFIATHRPWVGLTNAVITGPLVWDGAGNARISLEFAFKNFGPSPALAVFLMAKGYPLIGPLSIPDVQAKYMEETRGRDDPMRIGYALFPETDMQQPVVLDIRAEDIAAIASPVSGFAAAMQPTIIGYIEYRFAFGPPVRHFSQFVYHVRQRMHGGAFRGMSKEAGDIPSDELRLITWVTGWHAD